MAENFPQIVKEAKPQIQDAQQMTGRVSKKKSTQTHSETHDYV